MPKPFFPCELNTGEYKPAELCPVFKDFLKVSTDLQSQVFETTLRRLAEAEID